MPFCLLWKVGFIRSQVLKYCTTNTIHTTTQGNVDLIRPYSFFSEDWFILNCIKWIGQNIFEKQHFLHYLCCFLASYTLKTILFLSNLLLSPVPFFVFHINIFFPSLPFFFVYPVILHCLHSTAASASFSVAVVSRSAASSFQSLQLLVLLQPSLVSAALNLENQPRAVWTLKDGLLL